MEINFNQAAQAVNGTVLAEPSDHSVHKISTDTRTVQKGDLFFALIGEKFNGHAFIEDAVGKGAAAVVLSDEKAATQALRKKAGVILAKNTLTAYGDLARFYRGLFTLPVIAITGSSGKTTAKELIAHVLSEKFNVLKNKGTENNLIGVPKTILELTPAHDVLVLEMGTSYPGEIARLGEIANPQIGVLTQIGLSHLEGLKDLKGVLAEKLSMIQHIRPGGTLILNGADENLKNVSSTCKRVRVGIEDAQCEVNAHAIQSSEKGSIFGVGKDMFETPLIGRHNILNSLLAIAAAKELGQDMDGVRKAIASFQPVPGRLCPKNIDGIHFIDDSYNANPTSFEAALRALGEFKINGRKGVVCGDMLELGHFSEELHRKMGRVVAESGIDFVIACGPESRFLVEEAIKTGFNSSKIFYTKDSAEAAKICREVARAGDRVLVKGSRGMKMEKVFECFTNCSTR